MSTATCTSRNGYMEFTATETSSYRMCGLSYDKFPAKATPTSNFALLLPSSSSVRILFEDGASRGTFSTYATGDVFARRPRQWRRAIQQE